MKTLVEIQQALAPLLKADYSEVKIEASEDDSYFTLLFNQSAIKDDIDTFKKSLTEELDVTDIQVDEENDTISVIIKISTLLFDQFDKEDLLHQNIGEDKVITIDMSSPNIAKPMSYQHLRSTLIGNVTSNAYERIGYQTVKINHLGDWGIPLASIILAVLKWGDMKTIEENPMTELDKLYSVYLMNLQINPYLEEETLQTYNNLIVNDPEVIEIWQWLKDVSLNHFNAIYDKLNIKFDAIVGESFYNQFSDDMIELVEQSDQAVKKNQSLYLTVDDQEILIQDVDGHSTYLTRDLSAALYRSKQYHFDKALYVIGKEQAEHFAKLKTILKQLGNDWSDAIKHVGYSPVMIENDQNETPNKQDTMVLNMIDILTQLAKDTYQVGEAEASQIAVNSLMFETLDKYRDEILTINVSELDEIIGNKAYALIQSVNQLEAKLESVQVNSEEENTISSSLIQLHWLLISYPTVIKRFLTNYDTVVITKYLTELNKIKDIYLNQHVNNDRIDLNSYEYHLMQTTLTVMNDAIELLGLQNLNN